MPDEEYGWNGNTFSDGTGNGRRKRKKDPYQNPLGLSGKTPGMIRNTEETLRQSKETDNAIGEAAKQMNKPVPAVKIPDPVIPPRPQTEIPPEQTHTDGQNRSVNTFGYGTKSVDTRPTESEKRQKNYEDSLSITGANGGYNIPPVQPSTGNSESYPGEKEKLVEHSANEGFTIGNKSRTDEESERRIEETAAFLERFMKGNEKEQRFANGLSAPGESHKSILGMYTDAKSDSDNAMQGDWAQSIKDRDKSAFGQGLRDMYHSGMAGGYELGNEAATTLDLLEDARKINNALFLPAPYSLFENQFNGRNYVRDLTGCSGFKIKKYFRDKVKGHLQSRSQDNENASLDNPGYLSVKGAGAFLNELPHTLAGAAIASRVSGGTAALIISGVEGGMAAYTKRVDSEMDRLSAKPEGVMLLDPDYVRIKKEVRDPEQARYIMAKEYARQGVLADIFKGALKGMLGTVISGKTRNGTEGLILRTIQDVVGGNLSDNLIDGTVDYFKNKGNNIKNNGRQ